MKCFGNLYEFTSMATVESELDLILQCLESIKKSHVVWPTYSFQLQHSMFKYAWPFSGHKTLKGSYHFSINKKCIKHFL